MQLQNRPWQGEQLSTCTSSSNLSLNHRQRSDQVEEWVGVRLHAMLKQLIIWKERKRMRRSDTQRVCSLHSDHASLKPLSMHDFPIWCVLGFRCWYISPDFENSRPIIELELLYNLVPSHLGPNHGLILWRVFVAFILNSILTASRFSWVYASLYTCHPRSQKKLETDRRYPPDGATGIVVYSCVSYDTFQGDIQE